MKDAIEKNKKTTKVPRDCRSSVSITGANKVRRTGGQGRKITGRVCTADGMSAELLDGTKGTSGPELYQEKEFMPHTKITLQLFPIDEGTRMGLEHDGYHPYLELTLRASKKISSVLKHLNKKWGSSKVALGEPVLFPYNVHGGFSACKRWTMKDSDIRAGDIYAFIGCPANFRLRYGWFSTSDSKTCEELSTPSTPYEVHLQSGNAQKDCSSSVKKANNEEIPIVVTNEDSKLINDDGQRTDAKPGLSALQWVDDLTNISIGGLLSEASLQGKFNSHEPKSTQNDTGMQPVQIDSCQKSLASWADGLTNISIGGLLSEVSLQGKFNNNTVKSIGSNADLQSTQIISDSLDAFICAQSGCPQGPRPPVHDLHSSILDAEETCHAFPVQKYSSSGKRVSALSGSSGGCSQDSGSKLFRFSKMNQINVQAEIPEDQACQEAQTNVLLSSETYNDESSLGLSGIKWSDSLGPFDLGLPASRKLINGEKTSINGFVNSSKLNRHSS